MIFYDVGLVLSCDGECRFGLVGALEDCGRNRCEPALVPIVLTLVAMLRSGRAPERPRDSPVHGVDGPRPAAPYAGVDLNVAVVDAGRRGAGAGVPAPRLSGA